MPTVENVSVVCTPETCDVGVQAAAKAGFIGVKSAANTQEIRTRTLARISEIYPYLPAAARFKRSRIAIEMSLPSG